MEKILLYTIVLYLLLVTNVLSASSVEKQTYVIACDHQHHPNTTLDKISGEIKGESDVSIDIKTSHLQLNTSVHFSHLLSLTIRGEPGLTTVTCTDDDKITSTSAGIILDNITGTITLLDLKLRFCGSLVSYNFTKDEYYYSSALTFIGCQNLEVSGLVIEQSRGIGLMILNHKGGTVSIKASNFSQNKLPEKRYYDDDRHSIQGGGGVYILISNIARYVPYFPMSITFHNCSFENNIAHTTYYNFLYSKITDDIQERYGSGGGVHLSIQSGANHLFVSFSDCKFFANLAYIGGGLSIRTSAKEFNKITENITVELKDSVFRQNGCKNYTNFGGGALLSLRTSLLNSLLNIHYHIKNVTFIDNCAHLGGGVLYFSDRDRQRDLNNSVTFDNCTFKSNQAHIGSAINVAPNIYEKILTGFFVPLLFKNCHFYSNIVKPQVENNNQKTYGIGTVYASFYDMYFEGYNHFANNIGTAIYTVNGLVNFQKSSACFINNGGVRGGAVTLIGSSTLFVGAHEYRLINNTSIEQGGAMYIQMIDSNDFAISISCFIQYADSDDVPSSSVLPSEWKANMTFIGNKALHGNIGHAIYATSIQPCRTINTGSEQKPQYESVNVSEVFSERGITFDSDKNYQPQVATDGAGFTIESRETLKVIPGEIYIHGTSMVDDFSHKVKTSFKVTIQNHNHSNITLDPALSSYIGDKIKLTGRPKATAALLLHYTSSRRSYIDLPVELQECPPGFKISDIECKCICNTDAHVGLFKCNMNAFHAHILPGYWAGYLETPDGLELVTSACHYCDYNHTLLNRSTSKVVLPRNRNSSVMNDVICGKTRTGVACARCRDGYTVHYHSPGYRCKPAKPVACKLGWLLYILSELLPVTAFFVTVLLLNIQFTSGNFNSFVFFSQLLITLYTDDSHIISSHLKALRSYRLIYGLFNLDFFNSENLSFCLWTDATAIDILAFKYVTIIYALLLIAAVICFMNRYGGRFCGKCSQVTIIKTSVVHGITTFLIICYTQCVNVSLNLLDPVHLHSEDGSDFKPPPRVWLNGDIVYFSDHHLPYALPAIFTLVTIGMSAPTLLITFPLLNKILGYLGLEESKFINSIFQRLRINSLKPLLDSFQGCFKDNFRFFAGLYFLYKWIILVIGITTSDIGSYYCAISSTFLVILSVHVICQPYKTRAHNTVDLLLIIDLLLINALSFFHYHQRNYQLNLKHNLTTVTVTLALVTQTVLIYLPIWRWVSIF